MLRYMAPDMKEDVSREAYGDGEYSDARAAQGVPRAECDGDEAKDEVD